MRVINRLLLASTVLGCAASWDAKAQTLSVQELSDIVRSQAESLKQQADQIAALQARLVGAPAHSQDDAKVQAQAAEIATLQEQVAALKAQTAPPPTIFTLPDRRPAGVSEAPLSRADAAALIEAAKAGQTRVNWGEGGPVFASGDGRFVFRPKIRVIVDANATSGSRYTARNQTTTGSRAMRIGVGGSYGEHAFYLFDIDFADSDPEILSASLGWRSKVFGLDYDLRLGNVFNDRSFDGTTSSDATMFMERSVVGTAILPQKGFFGVGLYGRLFGPNWHASLSYSGDPLDHQNTLSDSTTLASRVHWNPVKTKKGMVHLGAWGFSENITPSPTAVSRNTIIAGRFNPDLRVQSGPLVNLDSSDAFGFELAGAYGPVIAWGEYGKRHVRFRPGEPVHSFDVDAWAVSAAWMITGEKAPYVARQGIIDFPDVKNSVFDGGWGAFSLGARYEKMGYHGLPTGGEGDAATLSGIWYLSSFARLMVEGSHWNTNNRFGSFTGRDSGETFKLRSELSF